jgi:hypothetical protein
MERAGFERCGESRRECYDMNSDDRRSESGGSASGAIGVDGAKKVLAGLNLAKKNFSLYPEGHIICVNALEALGNLFDTFLGRYGELKLEIEKDQIFYQGEAVLSEPPGEGSLPFTFFRDGIRTLSFTRGINPEELREFLRIISRNRDLPDEPGGDMVTDFWETRLPHVHYEVPDFYWENLVGEPQPPLAEPEDRGIQLLREHKLADWDPLPDPPIEQEAAALTVAELAQVQDMVREEEGGDPTAYLDALFDSLLQHREKENFEIIVEVMMEEFKHCLARKDFGVGLTILRNLQLVLTKCAAGNPWSIPVIDDFFITVSSSLYLDVLRDVWSDIDPREEDTIRQMLEYLTPEAIHSLCPILVQKQSVKMRQMLTESIISLASQDMAPLEIMAGNPGEKLMEKLVHVFAALRNRRAEEIMKKLLHHPSPYVRQEALKDLSGRNAVRVEDVFELIDDENLSTRHLVLKLAAQTRDKEVEGLLLGYLDKRKFKKSEDGHVLACFTALGQCGSIRSIPFLRKILLGRTWMPGFTRAAWLEGAAIALRGIGTKQTLKMLEKAGRCLNPCIRRAARKVLGQGPGFMEARDQW